MTEGGPPQSGGSQTARSSTAPGAPAPKAHPSQPMASGASDAAPLQDALTALAGRLAPGAVAIDALSRLSGGASQETWSFDAVRADGTRIPLILRRPPGGRGTAEDESMGGTGVGLELEAQVIRTCAGYGVPVPAVPYVAKPQDGLGTAYVMSRVEGETIARKILRNPEFANARAVMAYQCGAILARIHSVPTGALPGLGISDAAQQWQRYRDIYDSFHEPRPVFEYAFRWLKERLPPPDGPVTLVHGDFRNGNLMIGPEGVRAVLDWELTHLGDPAEDLGWICVNSWRFGVSMKPVGGFGELKDLLAGYRQGGGAPIDAERVYFWTAFGTLKWGIMCMMMVDTFRTGRDRSVERAAIGRRASETEIDLMNLLAPQRTDG
ncbi:MAG: phosphotransferase family protein [Alphaproteobacteria bacterium]